MSNETQDLTQQGSTDTAEGILRERLNSLNAGEEGIPLEEVLRDMRMMLLERLK